MRTEDNRFLLAELLNQAPYFHNLVGVEAGGGFIEYQYLRVVNHGLCKAYALTVTLRKFADFFVLLGVQSAFLYHLVNAVLNLVLWNTLYGSHKLQVIYHRHFGVKR